VSELPNGWCTTKIEAIANIKGGKRLPKGNVLLSTVTEHPYIRVTDFENGTIDVSNLKYLDSDTFEFIKNYTIGKNDLYISIAGTIGLVGEIPESLDGANLTENAAKICELTGVEKNYLRHVLRSRLAKEQFEKKTTSSGQPKLALFRIKDCTFPLPPLNEQIRIADKLDSMLAKVDAAQARLDKIPNILKRFRQSVLAAATSGELTKEWREDNKYPPELSASINWNVLDKGVSPHEIPSNWTWQHVGNIIDVFNSKRKPLKQADRDKRSGEYPYYGAFGIIDDIDDFLFDGRYLLLAEDGKNLESRQRPISLIAEGKFWVNNHAHVIQGKEGIKLDYLKYFFNSPTIEIDQFLTGMDQVKLNKNSMIKIPVPVPPEKEQKEIVRRVESLFTMAENFEKQYKDAKTRTKRLTQSILAKAFRGELVPQDDNDEPASELLARIKANLDHVTTKPKVKRKTKAEKSKD
jgi:type I restriction enzyme S subunit